jgi:hypothetical protein
MTSTVWLRRMFAGLLLITGSVEASSNQPAVVRLFLKNSSTVPFNDTKNTTPPVLWLNDNPITLISGDAMMLDINQWLRHGTNTLRVSGIQGGRVSVRVLLHPSEQILLEGEYDPQLGGQMNWVSALDFKLPIFLHNNQIGDQDLALKEVKAALLEMNEAIRVRNMAALRDFLTAGSCIWMKDAYGSTKGTQHQLETAFREFWDNRSRRIEPVQITNLKYIVGSAVVLVFVPGKEPYLLTTTFGNTEEHLPPVRLVKLSGRWIVWQ